jgi:hypothetical protein
MALPLRSGPEAASPLYTRKGQPPPFAELEALKMRAPHRNGVSDLRPGGQLMAPNRHRPRAPPNGSGPNDLLPPEHTSAVTSAPTYPATLPAPSYDRLLGIAPAASFGPGPTSEPEDALSDGTHAHSERSYPLVMTSPPRPAPLRPARNGLVVAAELWRPAPNGRGRPRPLTRHRAPSTSGQSVKGVRLGLPRPRYKRW